MIVLINLWMATVGINYYKIFFFLFPVTFGLFLFSFPSDLCIPNFKCSSKLPCTLEVTNESHEYVVSLTSFQLNPWTRYRSHVSAIFGLFQSNATQLCNDWWIVFQESKSQSLNVSKTWPMGWSCIETTHQIANPRYGGFVTFQKFICYFILTFLLSCSFFHLPLSSTVYFSLSSIAKHLRFPARGGSLLHHALTRHLRFKLPSHTAISQSSSSFLR